MTALTALINEQKALMTTIIDATAALAEVNRKIEAEMMQSQNQETTAQEELVCNEDDFTLAWDGRTKKVQQQTCRLFAVMLQQENYVLLKEDLCTDVLFDPEGSEGAVRKCIYRARKETKERSFPFDINTIEGKGYSLVKRSINVPKKRKSGLTLAGIASNRER